MSKLTEPGAAARLKSDRAARQARSLRKRMTPAEKMLWRELRRFPLEGSHWRKQTPIGPYIVDFVCHAARILVEVDGGVHDFPELQDREKQRENFLKGRGYAVLRYSNAEIKADVGYVVRQILSTIETRMSSSD